MMQDKQKAFDLEKKYLIEDILSGETSKSVYYDTVEWREVRELVLKVQGETCSLCSAQQNLHVHHIIGLYTTLRLPIDVRMNSGLYKVLCERCHQNHHELYKKVHPSNIQEAALYVQKLVDDGKGVTIKEVERLLLTQGINRDLSDFLQKCGLTTENGLVEWI